MTFVTNRRGTSVLGSLGPGDYQSPRNSLRFRKWRARVSNFRMAGPKKAGAVCAAYFQRINYLMIIRGAHSAAVNRGDCWARQKQPLRPVDETISGAPSWTMDVLRSGRCHMLIVHESITVHVCVRYQ